MSMTERASLIDQLIQAVIENDPEAINELIRQGADPNGSLDDDQVTPIHYAAQYGSLESIPVLVHAGADVKATTTPDGTTAVDLAISHGHTKVTQVLLSYSYFVETLH